MEKATVYSDDPATTARHWESQGAELLHVVDLNGAFAGVPKNLDAIKAIRKAIRIPIEVGGGIRDLATIETLIGIGINRIILGTAAIENPAFVREACEKFPGRIIVGIDAKEGLVAIKGWAEVTKVNAVDLAKQMQDYGVIAIIYTDIKRDGMLSGPNIEATKVLAKALHIPVIASGGVHTMKDIENLLTIRHSGVSGVITGKAIYSGSLNLREAIIFVRMNDNRCIR
jgi:phosphoribosylformimino-5-aminoimidazole carboxamide ribotide isomerase